MFFDDWAALVRVGAIGTSGDLPIGLERCVSGKRDPAKLNAFDFVIAIALGSALATGLLSSHVALVEGVAAMALLVARQVLVSWLSARSRAVDWIVKCDPTLLDRGGVLMGPRRRMRAPKTTSSRPCAAGHARLESVAAVVLETDGSRASSTRCPPCSTTPTTTTSRT